MRKVHVLIAGIVAFAGIAAFFACSSPGGSECFYANMCLDKCGGKVIKSGCGVQCDQGQIEQMQCPMDSGVDDAANLIQDTGADTPSDAVKDAPQDSGGG
jgi:hypothetical protein